MKLRQLSLLSLSSSHSTLTYPYLLTALNLLNTRALEDLVISGIYGGLITAKLDPLAQRVDVSSVSPLRDLKPNSVPQLMAILDDWNRRCAGVLSEIEEQVSNVRAKAAEKKRREHEQEAIFNKALNDEIMKDSRNRGVGKRGAGDGETAASLEPDRGEAMDLDETFGRGGQRNAKRGGRFGGFAGLGKRLGG